MESADPTKTTNPGHEGHGVHLCSRCGWAFPNAHPSSRHRRAHKRVCGKVEGYTIVANSAPATLGHSQSQHSAVSSFSDDEQGSDGDTKAPSVKGVIPLSKSVSEDGNGCVLERMNMSADDVFADAVSEFADARASLGGDEGLVVSSEAISRQMFGVSGFTPPVEDVAVTGGIVQASIDQADSNKSPQEGMESLRNPEQVTSRSEIPAKVDDFVTDNVEENKILVAFEEPDGLETDLSKLDDPSEVNATVVIKPMGKDANESCDEVTEEERESKDLTISKTEISQNEEKNLLSSDEILSSNAEDIPHINFDELLTHSAAEGSASASLVIREVDVPSIIESDNVVLVNNQGVESIGETEEHISYSLSVDDKGAVHSAEETKTLEPSLAHTGSGCGSDDDSDQNYVNSLTRASANDYMGVVSTHQVGWTEGNNNIIRPENGYDNIDIRAEDFLANAEKIVSENETESDNVSPVVLVQSVQTTPEDVPNQLVESSHSDRTVHLSPDVNSSCENLIKHTKESKDDKSDDAEVPDVVKDTKPASHDVLLQKLEEDLSDDEPIESFPATESSNQSLGNNQVDDGGVFFKDSSAKDIGQSQDPEKSTTILVADAPYDASSPNGSSLDGNWGSVSVLSTMSDAAGDGKRMKEAENGQSSLDKDDMFDPPSFLTLVEPKAQKSAAATSTYGEVQNPQQTESAKAAWFPSISNVPNDSHGRKKNEEIIAKVTNWSTGKQHSPLKSLLSEAKAKSPNSNPSQPVPTVNSILDSDEPDHPKDQVHSSAREWSTPAGYPDEIKREKRKAKVRPYWVPFMCCSSVK